MAGETAISFQAADSAGGSGDEAVAEPWALLETAVLPALAPLQRPAPDVRPSPARLVQLEIRSWSTPDRPAHTPTPALPTDLKLTQDQPAQSSASLPTLHKAVETRSSSAQDGPAQSSAPLLTVHKEREKAAIDVVQARQPVGVLKGSSGNSSEASPTKEARLEGTDGSDTLLPGGAELEKRPSQDGQSGAKEGDRDPFLPSPSEEQLAIVSLGRQRLRRSSYQLTVALGPGGPATRPFPLTLDPHLVSLPNFSLQP